MGRKRCVVDGRGISSASNPVKAGTQTACMISGRHYLNQLQRVLTVLDVGQPPGVVLPTADTKPKRKLGRPLGSRSKLKVV